MRLSGKQRYLMLTVDTEALPKRASQEHVKRLVWGVHDKGTAGVREMGAAADEFNAKIVFFVDICGAYSRLDEVTEAVRWLDRAGHDVQLHTHSEYLPQEFWRDHGFKYRPRFLNQYGLDKAEFTIRYFSKLLSDITGKPVLGYRAGSFRWNANTIRAVKSAGIPISFNNSMNAFVSGKTPFSDPDNFPFIWSNGVLEVPMTERYFRFPLVKPWWGRLQFPISNESSNPPWKVMAPFLGMDDSFLVVLLHSWSLLYWDENGHAVYRDDRRIEDFRKLVRKLSKDYDIITTADFLDLRARGKIPALRTVDLELADLPR